MTKSYPPPDELTTEIENEICWWVEDNGPCAAIVVTTRQNPYDNWRWVPVCDEHRRVR